MRKHRCTYVHFCGLYFLKEGVVLYRIDDPLQLIPEKDRYYRRRRFVGTQPVIVSGACHRYPHQIRVIIHRFYYGRKEYQELDVVCRGLSGI